MKNTTTLCKENDSRFTSLGKTKRIWSISAIHGNLEKLITLHDQIFPHIKPGDRVIYTGNYIGYGAQSAETIDEILAFRRALLASPGFIPSDLIYLRGAQEEMWQKLLQLQFAPYPLDALLWMLGNGLSETLKSYDLCQHDGVTACKQGMVGISDWTRKIRETVQSRAGHHIFSTHLVRAAFTLPEETKHPILFVHAGLDMEKPLDNQGDSFWWSSHKFDQIAQPYQPFQKVVRGYDPEHKGTHFNCVKATIDGGCGFGGDLVCAIFEPNGTLSDTVFC